jgi:hypothetical protein
MSKERLWLFSFPTANVQFPIELSETSVVPLLLVGELLWLAYLISCHSLASRKPLSLHTVSFGPQRYSASLRRMAQIGQEVQNNAPRDPLTPQDAIVLSSYSEALDSVRFSLL